MKAVVEFEIVPPPAELLRGSPSLPARFPTVDAAGSAADAPQSPAESDVSRTSPLSGLAQQRDVSGRRSLQYTERHSFPGDFGRLAGAEKREDGERQPPPSDARSPSKNSAKRVSTSNQSDGDVGSPVSSPSSSKTEECGSVEKPEEAPPSEASDEHHKDASTDSIAVISGKGELVCNAQQEKIVYFYVPEAQSTLKLQVYASLTLGMRLRSSYDLIYCGNRKLTPAQPLVPFLGSASILCFDGGGVLGISSLKILERLELELQKELRDPAVRLKDCFDMICGTSTGGVIALGMMTGLTIKEMINMWASLTSRVFDGNRTLFSGVIFEGMWGVLVYLVCNCLIERGGALRVCRQGMRTNALIYWN